MSNLKAFINIAIIIIASGVFTIGNGQSDNYLPDHFKAMSSYLELADSLKSPHLMIRKFSAIRLGQLGEEAAINSLKAAYNSEPDINLTDGGFGVRYHCIVSIASIGGQESDKFLKELSTQLLSPQVLLSHRQYLGDSLDIFYGLFKALSITGGVENEELLLKVFNSNLSGVVPEISYKAYLNIKLKNYGFSSLRDSLYYLLEHYRKITETPIEVDSTILRKAKIKGRAISSLIFDYSKIDPSILEGYMSALNPTDPFYALIEKIQKRVKSQLLFEEQAKDFYIK